MLDNIVTSKPARPIYFGFEEFIHYNNNLDTI